MPFESSLSKYIYSTAKKAGCLVVKIDASHRGWPDRLIIKNGRCMFIEVKRPDGKGRLSKIQKYIINELKKQNILVYVVDSKKDFDSILQNFIKEV